MKRTLLATAVLLATTSAQAGWTTPDIYKGWSSDDGSLIIGGDAEMNFDVVNNDKGVQGAEIPVGDNKGLTNTQLNDDSRIKLLMHWKNTGANGSFVSATIEPLMETNGKVEMDDAHFAFGRDEAWMFQVGRYEAMDLFPLGKDVAVFYAAGSDGIGSGVYYYMGKEARGRSGDAGQARIAGKYSNWTAEVSTVYGDTSEILQGSDVYLDDKSNISSKNNSFMIRPAVNYLSDNGVVSISFGGEYEAQSGSVQITHDSTGEKFDLSNRYGLAATTTLNLGELIWHTSVAYQDASELWKAKTLNSNIEYGGFGFGASFAHNEHKDANKADTRSNIFYTAYTVPVMDFRNAEVTFALSHSKTENAYGTKGNDEQTTAFRTRFNYYF